MIKRELQSPVVSPSASHSECNEESFFSKVTLNSKKGVKIKMNMAHAYQAYQNNQVSTISQEKLVTMLYDGALRFITQAIIGMEENNLEKKNTNFIKAQKIIAELMGNLNRDVGEIAENLFMLYDFMYKRLVEANIRKDEKAAQEVYELLTDLRNTWVEASQKVQSHNYSTNQYILNVRSE